MACRQYEPSRRWRCRRSDPQSGGTETPGPDSIKNKMDASCKVQGSIHVLSRVHKSMCPVKRVHINIWGASFFSFMGAGRTEKSGPRWRVPTEDKGFAGRLTSTRLCPSSRREYLPYTKGNPRGKCEDSFVLWLNIGYNIATRKELILCRLFQCVI